MIRLVKEIDVNEVSLSGAINIFHYYEDGTYTASVDLNEVMAESYKDGFKTIEDAQAWAEEQVEEHLEDW